MKKIFTLLFFVCTGTALFAQSAVSRRNDNNAYNDWNGSRDKNYKERRYERTKQLMEAEIADINREYNRKLSSVRNNRFMHPFKKQRLINSLESKRRDEIGAVYEKFNGMRRDYSYDGWKH